MSMCDAGMTKHHSINFELSQLAVLLANLLSDQQQCRPKRLCSIYYGLSLSHLIQTVDKALAVRRWCLYDQSLHCT